MAAKKKKASKESASAVDTILSRFGSGAVTRPGQQPTRNYEVVSTGSLGLDNALGIGGLPLGRIVEIYGPESSGKTTLTLHVIADAQRQGLKCAFIDAEHALDLFYADALGVRTDELDISQPDYGEQALEIADIMVQSGEYGVIVIDSVAALTPKAELDGEMGASHVGLQARMMGQALRKLTGAAARNKTTVIFINQLRSKIGVMFGSPETTPGGNALKFYASVRLDIRRIGKIKQDGGVTGNRTRAKVVKNKCSPPFREAEFDIEFGRGISREGELLELAVEHKVLQLSGAWVKRGDEKIAQGKENAKQRIREDEELRDALEAVLAPMVHGMQVQAALMRDGDE